MNASTPFMIVSGVPYEVTDVEGHAPSALEEFTGPVTIHTHGPTGDQEVCGSGGRPYGGAVRLYEKDRQGTGKDIRVWTVRASLDRPGFDAQG